MDGFKARFEIIYKKFSEWASEQGFKPNRSAFARHVGVSQGCMQKWEKGQIPSAKDIKKIHDRLGFSYDWLIAGEGEAEDLQVQGMATMNIGNERFRNRIFAEEISDKVHATATDKAVGQE